jgi:pimeloyl-ACP methyl ester carboxylesterase
VLEHILRTPDGRDLMLLEVGDPTGFPVLHHHGTPSCRLEVAIHADDFAARGLRVIAVDRPGFGRSTRRVGATVGEWAEDATLVVDHLGIERFGVSGYSAGGPSATAVAAVLSDRVDAMALFAAEHPSVLGVLPADAFYVEAAGRLDPSAFEAAFTDVEPDEIPPAEVASIVALGDVEKMLDIVVEGLAQGPAVGPASYYWSTLHPWGFDLRDVQTPTTLWHGERDEIVPPSSSDRYAQRLPHSTVVRLPDLTHLSLWWHAPELLEGVFGQHRSG